MKAIYFFLMISIMLGMNVYVIYRLVYLLPRVLPARGIVLGLGILAILSLFIFFFAGKSLPFGITSFVYNLGTSWIITSAYFFLIFLVLDVIRIFNIIPMGNILYNNWISFGVIVGLVGVVLLVGNITYHNKKRVELDIALNKTVSSTKPLKIVAFSDMHLGYSIGKKEFGRWIELINKENPDIVLIAGDLIDNDVRPLNERELAPMFKDIKSKYGIYAVPGNHEYISDINASKEFMEKAGVHFLMDKAVLIDDSFYIVGRDDRSYHGRKQLADLTEGLDMSKPVIVLDHQPYELEEVERKKIDLQISGHTHHGQIWPFSWVTDAIYEDAYGYLKKGDSHIYVSSGMGIWGGKFRVGTRSEYVVINLSL
ncbi:metallophosphoesterase [Bacteroides sp. 224]|uniref:metallophosphoesterase n=1 Tax=Bacteroides sp. 224 TaxID=2302936 RepID=UPI0013D18CFD|nr:metallophosphoesterase [Bacteroides sp. 224]NDV64855.1 metallophosphoesterase [Bacteroides sp. 224]